MWWHRKSRGTLSCNNPSHSQLVWWWWPTTWSWCRLMHQMDPYWNHTLQMALSRSSTNKNHLDWHHSLRWRSMHQPSMDWWICSAITRMLHLVSSTSFQSRTYRSNSIHPCMPMIGCWTSISVRSIRLKVHTPSSRSRCCTTVTRSQLPHLRTSDSGLSITTVV